MSEESDGSAIEPPKGPTLQQRFRSLMHSGQQRVVQSVKDFDAKRTVDAVLDAPKQLQREWEKHGATGVLTKFPLATVLVFLMLTLFFVYHSGFLDDSQFRTDPEPSLKVNGDLEVYLPEGSTVLENIRTVENDWSTNVMIIYIESPSDNITSQRILQEMAYVESRLNPVLSDPSDDVIYVLSLSTVIKEVNSSAPRVREAFVTQLGELGCPSGQTDDCFSAQVAQQTNDLLENTDSLLGTYAIPTQTTINTIVAEMYEDDGSPTPGLDKMARDADGDGTLDRAVLIVAVDDKKEAKEIIEQTQGLLDDISKEQKPCNYDDEAEGMCDWEDLDLTMTLTGPVPITNAVTEFSFKLFWQIFPLAIVLVALGLFIFHSDILQTGSWRPIQGFKVVTIAGLPTLCSVFWTLGIIGWLDYEVTMTVIIVGPILLALGVSYGLHITNRYAEEEGTKDEKIRQSLSSTGRAVFLSAVTTVIGFISLTFTPMAPIATVGFALSGGIIVVYILTMAMVPNLTLLLDLRKPKHPPLPVFDAAVKIPINYSKAVIAVFFALIFISAYWGQQNVKENIDLLGMAPEGEEPVIKMKQYSTEFNAGQIGMVLVQGNISGDIDDGDPTNDDPAGRLQQIEVLEKNLNTVNQTTAVSIVFLMKSVGVGFNASGTPLYELVNQSFVPEDIKDTAQVLLDQEINQDASFWDLLISPEMYGLPGSRQSQIFLLDVFYASLTDETRGLFVSSDFQRNLVYVDMPFIPVAETAVAVDQINEYTSLAYEGKIEVGELTGVGAVAIAVNELIVSSQWSSLFFAIALTLITLALVFKDIRFSIWTTSPVIATVAMQWLVMWQMDVPLSLVTVMIGSILVGVGVDFSIHIANRIKEMGGGIDAIREATVSTGMSLFEAATVTTLGMITAYQIPIPEIKPFVTVIIILLWIAAASALILLPAIFVTLEQLGVGSVGGASAMAKRLGLVGKSKDAEADVIAISALSTDQGEAW